MEFSAFGIVAIKEFRDSVRTRWFVLYTIAFTVLAIGLSFLVTSFSGLAGVKGFGRTAAGLVNLVLLIVPLMGLTAGVQALAGERERGTLLYLLSQPLDRAEIFLGKAVGLAAALTAAILGAFGATGLFLVASGATIDARSYGLFALLTLLLAMAALGLGLLISSLCGRVVTALGVGLFAWLALVFLGDLGLMGTAIVLRLGIKPIFALSMLNPLQVYKVAAVAGMEPSLDVLGPVGRYAHDLLGSQLVLVLAGGIALWAALALIVAYVVFQRRDAR